jgi:ABC-2 type transport system ATP-binding protein
MQITAGERVALLGANGAGKTTLLRAVTGRLLRHSGKALVLGQNLKTAPPSAYANVGFASEVPTADPVLRVREWFDFLADVHPRWSMDAEIALVERLTVDTDRRIAELSRGNLVKVALVAALATRPPLLVLDEPTNGLDPMVRQELLALLRDWVTPESDSALLFSSHLLEDVEALCDRAVLIKEGRVVGELAADELQSARRDGRLTALITDVLGAGDRS